MNAPNEALKTYFSEVIKFNVAEKAVATKVIQGFKLSSVKDLWKIGAYVEYVTDERLDTLQVMQDLGTTMYYGVGDCEDIARAQVVLGKQLNKNMYYLLMFPDNSLRGGHAVTLFIDDGFLTVLNNTIFYTCKDYKLSEYDIENNTQNFYAALSKINFHIARDLKQYNLMWIVKTDYNEKPIGYVEVRPDTLYGNVDIEKFPDMRDAITQEIKNLDLDVLLEPPGVYSLVTLIAIAGTIFILWWWLS